MITAAGITARYTVPEPLSNFGSGWDWAAEATDVWMAAAFAAGLSPDIISREVPDINRDVAIVAVDGTRYLLTVDDDGGRDRRVTAAPLPV